MPNTGLENTSGYKTFQATATAIGAYLRVKVDSDGLISVAGATDAAVGVTMEAVAASGYGTVKLWSAPGTWPCQIHSSATKGAALYPAAAGRVDDAGTTAIPFITLDTATAQGDVVEIIRTFTGA